MSAPSFAALVSPWWSPSLSFWGRQKSKGAVKGKIVLAWEKHVPAHTDILHSSSRFVKIFLPRIFPEIEKTNTWKNSNNCWSLPACKSHSEVSVGSKETLTVDSTDEHSSNRDQTQAGDGDRAFSVFQSLWLKHYVWIVHSLQCTKWHSCLCKCFFIKENTI